MAHLLIVEDDELLRDALGAQLAQAGHRITTAADGAEALELLALQGFDGVVLDLGLPLVDGLTVLRRLRQRLPALPVLILTARDGVEDRVEGLNAGADDYLTKPFNRDELLARLQALLRRASLPAFGGHTAPAPSGPAAGNLRLDPQLPRARGPPPARPARLAGPRSHRPDAARMGAARPAGAPQRPGGEPRRRARRLAVRAGRDRRRCLERAGGLC